LPTRFHLGDAERVEELAQHGRVGGGGDVLPRVDLGGAVREQVERDAAPRRAELRELVAPEPAVHQHAVHEEGDRALPAFDVGDAAGRCVDELAAGREVLDVHGALLIGVDRRCGA